MCNKAVDVCLLASKFVPDWFVPREMLDTLNKVVFCNNDTNLDFIDSNIVRFFADNVNILSV